MRATKLEGTELEFNELAVKAFLHRNGVAVCRGTVCRVRQSEVKGTQLHVLALKPTSQLCFVGASDQTLLLRSRRRLGVLCIPMRSGQLVQEGWKS